MLSVIKNDWELLKAEKSQFFIEVILTIAAFILAVVMTYKVQPKTTIAVKGEIKTEIENNQIDIVYVDKIPPKSELIQNRYDAAVWIDDDGNYQIETAKNETFKQELKLFLEGKQGANNNTEKRQIGTNIIGYMLMFILMQGVLYAHTFADEKEKHKIERIVVSPVHFRNYLMGHIVFSWLAIVVPTFFVVMIAKIIGVDIGFSLLQYAVMIGILGFFATALAICVNSFFSVADDANMLCNNIIIFSSILSGAFYSMENGNHLLQKLVYLLPQKDFLYFVDHLEKNMLNSQSVLALLYVIIASIVLVMIGIGKTAKEYSYRSK